MKIGFDAKRSVQNNTGLGNYSRYVVEILSAYFPDNQYFLFAPKEKQNPRLLEIYQRDNTAFIYPPKRWRGFLASLWRLIRIPKELKTRSVDIYHGLSNELPLGIGKTSIRSVVTIHDLIFLRYPSYYKLIDRSIYKWKFRRACRKSDAVVAISECTKRDIISFFGIAEKKIRVIYQGCHPAFHEEVVAGKKKETSEKYGLPTRFLLYVGSIETRKNLLLAVKALRMLGGDVHLVAVGKRTPYQEQVEQYASENGLGGRLHVFNNVPFDYLPAFYALADIFIYPSRFEGFGIPIIEALAQGVPVVAAKGSCLEEAGGPHSHYVDPDDAEALAAVVRRLWNSPGEREHMAEKGRQYVRRFSEKMIAGQLFDLYTSLLEEF